MISHRRFLILLFILFAVWMAYTQFFAARETLRMIDAYYIDKAFHFLGGVWVAGTLLFLKNRKRKKPSPVFHRAQKIRSSESFVHLIIILFAVSIGWEVFELLVFPDVRNLFRDLFAYWASDTAGDLVFDMLGGSMYIFLQRKKMRVDL